MNLSHVVTVVFVAILGVAACGESEAENKERTAACADRTNGVSCGGCCETKNSSFKDGKCICKGEVVAPKSK